MTMKSNKSTTLDGAANFVKPKSPIFDAKTFGGRVRWLCNKSGLDQRAFGRLAGLGSPASVNRIMGGKSTRISMKVLGAIIRLALDQGMSLGELFLGDAQAGNGASILEERADAPVSVQIQIDLSCRLPSAAFLLGSGSGPIGSRPSLPYTRKPESK